MNFTLDDGNQGKVLCHGKTISHHLTFGCFHLIACHIYGHDEINFLENKRCTTSSMAQPKRQYTSIKNKQIS